MTETLQPTAPRARLWCAWILSRILLGYIFSRNTDPLGDVSYYFRGMSGTEAGAMSEYPAVSVWPLEALYGLLSLGAVSERSFTIGFVVLLVLIDATFFLLILSSKAPGRLWAAGFWILFGPACANIFYVRLDLIPGLLVAGAAFALSRHPRVASALLAVATAVKLWPGVLAAGLVGNARRLGTWVRVGVFVGTLALLCLAVAVFSGPERLVSPLSYQDVRGLQIESIFATPFMVLATRGAGPWEAYYADSKSFEIFGPGVETAAHIASICLYAVVALALLGAVRALFRPDPSPRATRALWLLLVCAVICTNKVFSPQYLLWLGPLLAICLLFHPADSLLRAIAGVVLVMAVLGMAIYPFYYEALLEYTPIDVFPVVLLLVRNLLMLVCTLLAAVYFSRVSREPAV